MALQKQAIKKALSENQAGIRLKLDALFTPPPAETKMQGWMNNASRLFAVYDGVMTADDITALGQYYGVGVETVNVYSIPTSTML